MKGYRKYLAAGSLCTACFFALCWGVQGTGKQQEMTVLAADPDTGGKSAEEVLKDAAAAGETENQDEPGEPDTEAMEASRMDALTGKTTINASAETLSGESFSSENSGENAVLVSGGGALSLEEPAIEKSGDEEDMGNCLYYGWNAALNVSASSSLNLTGGSITTSGKGAAGLFALGENAYITASGTEVSTGADWARGLGASFGGKIDGEDLSIRTTGDHSAGAAAEEDTGTVSLTGGDIHTEGSDSPCLYAEGDVMASGLSGEAEKSPILIMRGKRDAVLSSCRLSGAGEAGFLLEKGVLQSVNDTGNLTLSSSELTASGEGPFFLIRGLNAELMLSNNRLAFESGILLKAEKSAGTEGQEQANGSTVTITGKDQTLEGDLVCDRESKISLKLTGSSSFSGTVNGDGEGTVRLALSDTSVWEVTGDSHLSSLTLDQTGLAAIHSNGHKIYYDSSDSASEWLKGETKELPGGGELLPEKRGE